MGQHSSIIKLNNKLGSENNLISTHCNKDKGVQ